MANWRCGIKDCGMQFVTVDELVQHQVDDHPKSECRICGESCPAGYAAIHHAFNEHDRLEFARAYGAKSDDIRLREAIVDQYTDRIDLVSIIADS